MSSSKGKVAGKSKTVLWTEELQAKLAEEWQSRPILYNHTITDYTDNTKKDAAWQEICIELDVQCKFGQSVLNVFQLN